MLAGALPYGAFLHAEAGDTELLECMCAFKYAEQVGEGYRLTASGMASIQISDSVSAGQPALALRAIPLKDMTGFEMLCKLVDAGWQWEKLPKKHEERRKLLFSHPVLALADEAAAGGADAPAASPEPRLVFYTGKQPCREYLQCLLDKDRLRVEYGTTVIPHWETPQAYRKMLKGEAWRPRKAPLPHHRRRLVPDTDVLTDVARPMLAGDDDSEPDPPDRPDSVEGDSSGGSGVDSDLNLEEALELLSFREVEEVALLAAAEAAAAVDGPGDEAEALDEASDSDGSASLGPLGDLIDIEDDSDPTTVALLSSRGGRGITWYCFRFVWAAGGAHGSIQATCPCHIGAGGESCRQTRAIESEDGMGAALLRMKHWCVLGADSDRKYLHLLLEGRSDALTAGELEMAAASIEAPVPGTVIPDNILDEVAAAAEVDRIRRRAEGGGSSSSADIFDSSSANSHAEDV